MCTYRVSTDCSATSILTVKYDVYYPICYIYCKSSYASWLVCGIIEYNFEKCTPNDNS